jgi:thiamine-monophosphate kinase
VGEFELIEQIRERLQERGGRVVWAAGDDAAVVRTSGVVVTSVDLFVEGVHFRLATTSLRDLGHKCLAASLSDLAAVGAEPGEAYIALGLPENVGEREVIELIEGAERLAADAGATICGGDLSAADALFVSVTVVGHATSEAELVSRAGAQPGDAVGVTGRLGGAGAGLLLLERKDHGIPVYVGERLIERQLRPRALLEAGRALARAGASAMIDVSDGVASDATRIAEASEVAVTIELDNLPVEEGVDSVAELAGMSGAALAATAGEDYELLFTTPPVGRSAIEHAARESGTAVTWIGSVSAGAGVRLLDGRGEPRELSGWDHLARRAPTSRRRRERA